MINLITNCVCCGEPKEIQVDEADYEQWQNGALVQNAFPNLSPSERELLISGVCDHCWNDMFGEEE